MGKSPDAFRTISEVADWLGIQAHVLRFWESKFAQVKPVKRAGGRRYYRPTDMQLLGGIKKLLHDDGLTIKGVQKILREQGVGHVSALSHPIEEMSLEAVPDGIDQIEATVVPFHGRADRTEPEPQQHAPQITLDLGEDTTKNEPGPETAAEPEPVSPAHDPAALPAFLHRSLGKPAASIAETPTPMTTESTAEPMPTALPARADDLGDPPSDDDIDCAPGLLTRLARLDALTAEQARQLAPLATQLRGWLDRNRNAGLG